MPFAKSREQAHKALIEEILGDRYAAGNAETQKLIGMELATFGYRLPDS